MKLSELFRTPFRLKGGSVLNLRGFSKRVIDREINDEGDISGEYKDEECLGFTAVDGDVTVSLQNNYGNAPVVYYKREGQDWTLWDYSELNITEGETIRFYGDNNLQFSSSSSKYSKFIMAGNGKIEASGDCGSLASKYKTFTIKTYCFYSLFYGCNILLKAPKLSAIFINSYCYAQMFYNCTSLINAPELPAKIIYDSSYFSMFYNCTSLVNTPELPATIISNSSYTQMFYGCNSLINAPQLPATKLGNNCYSGMFRGCTKLETAPEILPATELFAECYNGMFTDCYKLKNAPILPATTLTSRCYYYMFSHCEELINAPVLPATTLVSGCYQSMFMYCKKLSYIKAMFITEPNSSYTGSWVSGVPATGTFVKNSQATWDVSGSSGIPEGWTVETAED